MGCQIHSQISIKTYQFCTGMLQAENVLSFTMQANKLVQGADLVVGHAIVVAEDKSMNQMINTDKEIYDVKTLIELENLETTLAERNLKVNRVQGRNRKGRVQVKRDGSTGVGPYTHQYRQELLARLKGVQEKVGLELITQAEIHRIEEIWAEEISDLALLDAGVTT